MNVNTIKNKITGLSGGELTRFIADNWMTAQSGLWTITDDTSREIPVSQYPLQTLCLAVGCKDGFHDKTSAEKEKIVERMKAVLEPVKPLLDDRTDMALPSYSFVLNLTPKDGETERFNEQLKEDFKRIEEQNEADALALTLYAVVYAYYRDFDEGVIEHFLQFYVDDPYDIGNFARMTNEEQLGALNDATKKVYATPQTNASAAYTAAPVSPLPSNTYHSVKVPGRWKPLKIYLIATTVFVALVFGLVFLSMNSGVGASAMSIMDVNGQMAAIEPGMEPATLILFGTVDYDGLIAGIKNAAIIFVIWRVVLTAAVYIFNSRRRRQYHP